MAWKIFLAAALMALAILLNSLAVAKVKKYTDEKGVLHITNSGEPGQPPSSPQTDTPTAPGKGRRGNVPAPPPGPPPELEPEPEAVEDAVPEEMEPPEPPQ